MHSRWINVKNGWQEKAQWPALHSHAILSVNSKRLPDCSAVFYITECFPAPSSFQHCVSLRSWCFLSSAVTMFSLESTPLNLHCAHCLEPSIWFPSTRIFVPSFPILSTFDILIFSVFLLLKEFARWWWNNVENPRSPGVWGKGRHRCAPWTQHPSGNDGESGILLQWQKHSTADMMPNPDLKEHSCRNLRTETII